MEMSFRWYGHEDPVTLKNIRQIPGMKGIVTAVYDIPVGQSWPLERIEKILGALYLYNLKATDMSKAKPDFIVTASALQKAFEDDETKASVTYINKIVEVTGKIASVKPARKQDSIDFPYN